MPLIHALTIGWLSTVSVILAFPQGSAAPELDYPLAIAVQDDQTIYLADRNLPGIWKIEGPVLSLFYQGEKKFRTPLNAPRSLAIDREGRLLAGDSATREVYRFNSEGQPEPLTDGGIGIPMGIAVTSTGDLLVADLELHRIWKVPAQGGTPELFAEVRAPRGVWIDAEDRLWVVAHDDNQLLRIAPDGKTEVVVKGRPFDFPHTVVVDDQGNAYVCDGYAQAIWKVDASGKPVKWVKGEPLVRPVGMAWQGETLLVVDPHAKAVFQVDPQGKITPLEIKSSGS